MSYYLVAWIAFSCPGGLLSGLIPGAARPLVCSREARVELIPRKADAERKVRELGPGAASRLWWCRGLKCSDVKVSWESVVKIG